MARYGRARTALAVAGIVLGGLAGSVWANSGTPLMMAGALHLIVGNAVIGVVEAWVLCRWFGASLGRALILLIPANYASAAAMFWLLPHLRSLLAGDSLGFIPLYHLPELRAGTLLMAFLMSVFLEWPFFLAAVGGAGRWRRSWGAVLAAHCASFLLLVPFYSTASRVSLQGITVAPALSFAPDRGAWIYFIGLRDGGLYRARLNGAGLSKVLDARISEPGAYLFVSTGTAGRRQLRVQETHSPPVGSIVYPDGRLLMDDLGPGPAGPATAALSMPAANFRPAFAVGSDGGAGWEIRASYWDSEGLTAYEPRANRFLQAAVELPFVSWRAWSPIVTPGGLLVFQWGEQIAVLELSSGKLGVAAVGHGPVVALSDPP